MIDANQVADTLVQDYLDVGFDLSEVAETPGAEGATDQELEEARTIADGFMRLVLRHYQSEDR
jgi:hypothetical protein